MNFFTKTIAVAKVRKHKRLVSKEEIESHYHETSATAAKKMGISPSQLKILCREYGIKRWPPRQLKAKDPGTRAWYAESHQPPPAQVQELPILPPLMKHLASQGISPPIKRHQPWPSEPFPNRI